MISLSKTTKLDGIYSWSLQAGDDCPGSKNSDGTWVDACIGCYARSGNYFLPKVKAVRARNKTEWKQKGWVDGMVAAISDHAYFRWFDSGDMYALSLANKIYNVMKRTPNTKHWLPTRMAKFDKFKPIIAKMQALPNVVVRFSSDSIIGEFTPGVHGSTIIPDYEANISGVSVCYAYQHGGKCNGCRSCWDKDVAVVAYPVHGKIAKKHVRMKLELA